MTITDHDSYIAAAPEPFRPGLSHLRALLAEELPEADEIVAYNMPGFSIHGEVVASYAALSKQCGLYLQSGVTADHAEELAALGLKSTKTERQAMSDLRATLRSRTTVWPSSAS